MLTYQSKQFQFRLGHVSRQEAVQTNWNRFQLLELEGFRCARWIHREEVPEQF